MNGNVARGIATRRRILDAIRRLSAEQRRPPTLRQIGDAAGISSKGHLHYHVTALRAQGLIEPSDGYAGILLTQEHS
jgi:SOS-response transcriptional repressor LexA